MRLSLNFLEKKKRENEAFPFFIHKLDCKKDMPVILPHWHYEMEILYALNNGTVQIDGDTFCFEENDIIFVNKNKMHSAFSFSSENMFAIVFNYKFLDFRKNDLCQNNIMNSLQRGELLFPHKISRDNDIYYEVHKYISEIIELYYSSIIGKELKIKCNLYNIIFLCYSNKQLCNDKELSAENKTPQLTYIKSTITYMEENISCKIAINDLAMNVNLSVYYLIKLFKLYTGVTPIEYLTNLRLENSLELLRDGCSVTQTAYEVGFNNLSYFIRIFKSRYNTTPKSFQKKHYCLA